MMLPYGIQVGDWFGFENMGAYTLCAASQFNGFEVSKVIYTVGGGSEEDVATGEHILDVLADYARRV
jgi:ornithine decarboxylase